MAAVLHTLGHLWPHIVGALHLLIALFASGHAILHKRDVRAAVAWAGIIWLVPFLGAALYLLLGINRIQRRAAALGRELAPSPGALPVLEEALAASLTSRAAHLDSLAHLMNQVARRPLLEGNRITPLCNGDQAYPAMLQAIGEAKTSVSLGTYIFDNDPLGRRFVDALAAAIERGVQVRVLIDDIGLRYTPWRPADHLLRRRKVPTARFLPSRVPWRAPYMNLRDHRKVMVVDGELGFTGGMNIRYGHLVGDDPPHPVQDVHFQLEGPIVGQLQECFAEDWLFTTGERLTGTTWFAPLGPAGTTVCRAITDGPDEDFEKLHWVFNGALACARHTVRVVTPYFLPDAALLTAMSCAALRGVTVDVVLPQVNNQALVQWASTTVLPELLRHGCRVWLTAPPFDHSKLMVVDGAWVLLGSGNWDARSLRLNFELNVECYDAQLAGRVGALIDDKLADARQLSLSELQGLSLRRRLRNGVARLLTPYI